MFLLEALTFSTVYEYRIDIITFQNTFLKISIGCAMCMESTIEPFFYQYLYSGADSRDIGEWANGGTLPPYLLEKGQRGRR